MISTRFIKRCAFAAQASTRSFSQFKKVGVVGLGLMGHGVAQVTAAAGFDVVAIESNNEALAIGMKRYIILTF
jgi:phosphoglycerate dehydrogenase-like enzyme